MNALAQLKADDFASVHRLTIDEVLRMVEAGVLRPNQPVELIDGVLVDMASEGWLHVDVKARLIRWFIENGSRTLAVIPDSTLHLPPHDAPEPDCYIYPDRIPLEELTGRDVMLVVEVADSSLNYDLKFKPVLYGSFGIQEYWVIDLVNDEVIIHKMPRQDGYAIVERHGFAETLLPPGFDQPLVVRQLRASSGRSLS